MAAVTVIVTVLVSESLIARGDPRSAPE